MKRMKYLKRAIVALVFGWMSLTTIAQDQRTLMTIEDKSISVDEFLAIYNKNNTSTVVDKKSMEEYLDLFINFKLKVKEAESLGMDTAQKFINELEGYRRQLAQPYLVDREMNEQLIREAYDRMNEDIAAYHILVKVDENAPAKDTLAAIQKLKSLSSAIKSEKDMQAALERIRGNNDSEVIAEDLGYFTAFSMVYPFESAAYQTPVGTVSKPVRTRFGYHVIFVRDRRPARGEIKASHIMIKSTDDLPTEEKDRAREKIDEIYQRLLAGEDFSALAQAYSEDKASAKNGGQLPWFGTGRMVASFEDAAFSIANDGEYTKPVKTPYGWHIIKRDEYKGIATFDELKGAIKKRIERDSRGQKGRLSLLKKLKDEYTLSYNYKMRDAVHKLVGSAYLDGTWSPENVSGLVGVVMVISDNVYSQTSKSLSQQDYFDYLLKYQRKYTGKETLKEVLANQWDGFVNAALIDFENGILEAKYPEFKSLMTEYHDGILLFDLMDLRVWSKAVNDSVGLEAFYKQHQNDYMWGERVDASVYLCENADIAKKSMKLAKKRLKKGLADNDILDEVNASNPLNLSIRSGIYARGDDEFVDQVSWVPGIYKLESKAGKTVLVQIYNVMEPQPKSLDECRGLVTSDYQNQLEEEWIKKLRSTYKFSIDMDVFNSIANN